MTHRGWSRPMEFFVSSAQPWSPHFEQATSFERGPA